MPHHKRLPRLFFIPLLGLIILAAGCRPPKPDTDPAQDAKAMALALAARKKHADIFTTKGQGRLTLMLAHGKERFRLAWAAQAPNRLRLTLLASGHPVETIAASGKWISIVSHTGRHPPKSALSTDPDLSPYINLPVHLSDMVNMLLGRFPLRRFDRAWFAPESPRTVRTSKNFSSLVQEVQFDDDGKIAVLTLLEKANAMVMRIEYLRYQVREGRIMPETMRLTDKDGNSLELTLSRILFNPEVKPSVFRLTGAGS
jgi:outer membrane biogenesis lipoprotein LolB